MQPSRVSGAADVTAVPGKVAVSGHVNRPLLIQVQFVGLEAFDSTRCIKLVDQGPQRQNALNVSLVHLAMQEDMGDECRAFLE